MSAVGSSYPRYFQVFARKHFSKRTKRRNTCFVDTSSENFHSYYVSALCSILVMFIPDRILFDLGDGLLSVTLHYISVRAPYEYHSNQTVCIRVAFDLGVEVVYTNKDNQVQSINITGLNDGRVKNDSSYCYEDLQLLALEDFLPGWVLRLQFNKTTTEYFLNFVELGFNFNSSNFTAIDDTAQHYAQNYNLKELGAQLGCEHHGASLHLDMKLINDTAPPVTSVRLLFNQPKVQAFVNSEIQCQLATRNDYTVPLVVGISLGVLIVVVIVVFLFGRRHYRKL